MEVLTSCEESGPGPVLSNSSVEHGGRSDMTIACSSSCCSLFLAKVEVDGSNAAFLVEMTVRQLDKLQKGKGKAF